MFVTLGFFGFLIFAMRSMKQVIAEKEIFEEFQQRKISPLFLMLFPVGPLVLWLLPYITGWIPAAAVAAACYLLAFLVSRRHIAVFERSGTSRTDGALESVHMLHGGALVGLVYVGIFVVYSSTIGRL